ncbi:hypothetical protein AVEN_79119-1 [Araneus ventricosus]|uniref:Pre-C2HC domain-containing protein n=1 Tax=Araneus ventricosus TaxID=182803 RepID=A0A4Y2PVI1_ARAVE|nr:hypothetical protein AVEN_79119-1 [Araneus ventricosus]
MVEFNPGVSIYRPFSKLTDPVSNQFSTFSSTVKNYDYFKLVPTHKAAKARPAETNHIIETSNKFVHLTENENEPPKISVPTINLKLTDDYNLTLQEIYRQFPKTSNKFDRGFIRITPFSLEERDKIIELLNQSGKEYVLSEAPENRPVKIVIKGLPATHKNLIAKELEENDFKVLRINQLRNFRLKTFHPIFLVEISKSPKINDIKWLD